VRRAVFLDKDGTLINDVPYNVDPDLVRLREGAGEALRRLAGAGYRLVVVSNQSGVARGLFAESALAAVERRLRALLWDEGVSLDAFAACTHLLGGAVARYAVDCACRKPKPGLLLDVADRLGLDLERSWMVGDILDDVEAGRSAGCRTVLLDAGTETEWILTPRRVPHDVAPDLPAAADAILAAAASPSLEEAPTPR
jgi:histidinol-phosphate phosphatase family protein